MHKKIIVGGAMLALLVVGSIVSSAINTDGVRIPRANAQTTITLYAPNALQATALSRSQIKLTWQNSNTQATGYYIYRSIGTSTTFSSIATIKATTTLGALLSYTSGSLKSGTTYNYKLRAYWRSGSQYIYSGYSPVVGATTLLQGNVLVKRVGFDETATTAPLTYATLDGVPAATTSNPRLYTSVLQGDHIAGASDKAGFTKTAGTCTYKIGKKECTISTFPITPTCDGTWCTVPVSVFDATTTKLAMKYVDVQAPTVFISSPTSGTAYMPSRTVTITASSIDNKAVTKVEIYDGGVLKGTDTATPYTYGWGITSSTPVGAHTWTAKSYDAAGNSTVSSPVVLYVNTTTTATTTDTTAPLISGITSTNVTSTSATILWTTNELSDTQVEYGTTTAYGSTVPLLSALVTSHSESLTGLTASTTYHYRVKSRDAAGNLGTSIDQVLTTASPTTQTFDFSLSNIANVSMSAGAFFGLDVIATLTSGTSSSVSFSVSGQPSGVSTSLSPTSCILSCNTRLSISTPSDTPTTSSTVTITATANNVTRTRSFVLNITGTAPGDTTKPTVSLSSSASGSILTSPGTITFAATASDNIGVTKVELYDGTTLTATDTATPYGWSWNYGATDNGTHSFTAKAYDAAGNSSTSNIVTLNVSIATSDLTPPTVSITAPASGATVSGSAVTLSANASDNIGIAGVQFKLDGVNLGSEDTISPYSVSWNSASSTNGTHTLSAVARDTSGNTSTASIAVTASNDTTAPTISGITASSVNTSSAILSWSTNELSDTQIDYGTSTAYGFSSPLLTSLVTSHSQTVSGLVANTTYHYRARSKDAAGNLATSTDQMFVTSQNFNFSISNSGGITVTQGGAGSNTISTALVSGSTNTVSFSVSNLPVGVTAGFSPTNCNPTCSTTLTLFTTGSTPIGSSTILVIATGGGVSHSTNLLLTVNPVTSAKFVLSDRAQVTTNLNVRSTPSTSGTLLGTQLTGALGTIVGGPTYADGFWWWNVNYDSGVDGWSVEDYLVKVIPDTTSPNVTLGSTITGTVTVAGTATFTATATDNVGVTKVEFYDGSTLKATDTVSPYTYSWSYTSADNGTHSFKARAYDAAGNVGSSSIITITLAIPTPDTTPPSISITAPANLATVSGSSVTISANASDNIGVAGVQFKLDGANLGSEDVVSPYSVVWNSISSTNGVHALSATARDTSGNTSTTSISVTTANDTTAPVITSTTVSSITTSSASFFWITDELSDSQVDYGTTSSYGSQTALNTAPRITHLDAISNLSPNTTYHFRVKSRDAAGNLAVSTDQMFTTQSITTPFDFSVTNGGTKSVTQGSSITQIVSATLVSGTTQAVTFSTSGLPSGATASFSGTSCTPTCSSIMTIATLGSTPMGSFTITITATGGSVSKTTSFTLTVTSSGTSTSTGPTISGISFSSPIAFDAKIVWTTNVLADSQIDYGTTNLYGQQTTLDSILTTSHSQTIQSLNPGTTYHFRVKSRDAAGNLATSIDQTFVMMNFNLSNSGPITLSPGLFGSNVISTNILTGTNNKSASFDVTGLPSGTSAYFAPQGCIAACSTTLVVYATSTTSLGNSSLTVSSNVNGLIKSTSFTLSIVSSVTPTLTLTLVPAPTGTLTTPGDLILKTVTNGMATATVDFFDGTSNFSRGKSPVLNNAPWNYNYTINGAHSFSAHATDAYGHVADSAVIPVTVNNLPPENQFTSGDRVDTTANLNVRSTPSTSGALLGTQPFETLGTVTGSPVFADGFWWWNINYDSGVDGWSVNDYLVRAIPTGVVTRNIGGTYGDTAVAVAGDASGNLFVAGIFNGTVNFHGATLTSAGGSDWYLAKINRTGTLQWAKRLGGAGDDSAASLVVDKTTGDVVVGGIFAGTANFGGLSFTASGTTDIALAKYSGTTGAHIWSKQFGGPLVEGVNGLAIDGNGNVILTGYLRAKVNFGGTTLKDPYDSDDDVYIAKFTSAGAHIWSKNFVNTGNDDGYGIAVDANGNIAIVGSFSNTIDFGGGVMVAPNALTDIFIAKFNASGTYAWQKQLGSPTTTDQGSAIAFDKNGDLVFVGYSIGAVDLGGGLAVLSPPFKGTVDSLVAKYDGTSGGYIWGKRLGGGGGDALYGVATDASNNVIVAGSFDSASLNIDGTTLSTAGQQDIFLVKFNSDGGLLSKKSMGGAWSDVTNDLTLLSDSTPVVAGSFYVTGNFGGPILSSAGNADGFIAE